MKLIENQSSISQSVITVCRNNVCFSNGAFERQQVIISTPSTDFQVLTAAGRYWSVNKQLKSPALTRVFLHVYHNSAALQNKLCSRKDFTSHKQQSHSAGITDEEENHAPD